MSVHFQPKANNTVSPYIMSADPEKLAGFVAAVFDAAIVETLSMDNGKRKHVEVRIGDSVIMFGSGGDDFKSNHTMVHVYVPDADAAYQKAISLGAIPVMPPENQFYGDRHGGFQDHEGNQWWVATHLEDLTIAEIQARADAQ